MDYCPDCPRRTKDLPGHPGAVHGTGRLDAPLLVVGMSPGREELMRGEPFVGASGHLLRVHGGVVGLFREDMRILNTSMCWPCGAKGKTLSATQIEACVPGLWTQIANSSARVVLCLGAEAFDAVTGLITWERAQQKLQVKTHYDEFGEKVKAKQVGINQWRGYLIEPSDCVPLSTAVRRPTGELYQKAGVCPECKAGELVLGCSYCSGSGKRKKGDPKMGNVEIAVPRAFQPTVRWIIGTYHPSFIMRTGMKALPAFVNDVARVRAALDDKLDIVKVEYETRLPA